MSSCAANVIAKMGGTRKAAAILDYKVSTVQSWKNAKVIPAKHQREVIEKAKAAGITLTPDDMITPPAETVAA